MKDSINFQKVLLLVCTALVAFSLPLLAQERFGNIGGSVKDATGAVVPDATVTATNVESQRALSAKTRSDGSFSLVNIEPGRYSLSVVKKGFRRYEVKDLLVVLGKTTNVDAAIEVGAATESIEVSGTAEQIDTSSTMVAHNVIAEEIDRLPKARDFQNIALFSPSVNTGQIEGGYQINGASAAENAYYIDGVATNSVIDGSARQAATFDYLQEVQVKTTGLEAEYGGAMGGVVSAVTKSGGNTFHGDVHYYYYGSKLNAGPTKRLALDPNPAPDTVPTSQYFQDDKQRRHNNEFGGSLSGPIVKDKLWFYTAASPRWTTRSAEYVYLDPNSGVHTNYTMNQSGHQINWFNKLSYQPTERIRLNLSWLYTPTHQIGALPAYNGWGKNQTTRPYDTALGASTSGFNQAENSTTGQVTITLSNRAILNVEGGRYYLNYKEVGIPYQTSTIWGASSVGMADVDPLLQQVNTYRMTPDAAQIYHDLTTRTYVQTSVGQVLNLLGQHNLKFGVGTQKNVNNVNKSDYGSLGLVTLFWGQSYNNQTGRFGYYTVDEGGTIGSAGSNITHLYVQDSWKILRRLTINPGVRFEKETIPSFRTDIQKYAFQFGFGDKIAPRIGAAYDVLGNGRLKVSFGWGRYYDWTKYDLARGTFGGDVWHTYYRSLDTASYADVANINLSNLPGTNLRSGAYRDRRLPGFQYLDKNVKPMSADTMNAGVEWEFKENYLFTGRFVRNKLNRTIEDMGALDAEGNELYRYGNPGEGTNLFVPASGETCVTKIGDTCAVPMPKAERVYDAMELSLNHRFGSGWQGNVSYVYSKLWGNYSGTQSTDEVQADGRAFAGNQAFSGQIQRPGGNANRYFDLDEALYDAHGNLGLYGRLPTDRPHVLKFYGSKQFKFGTQIGTFFRVMSGTPVTTQMVSYNDIPVYVEGRGNAGRTPVFSQTDLVVSHELKLGKDEVKRLRFEFNITNLFNQKTSVYTFDRYNQEPNSDVAPILNNIYDKSGALIHQGVDLSKGFDWKAMVAAAEAANPGSVLDSRFAKAALFNPGFQGRFLVKFIF